MLGQANNLKVFGPKEINNCSAVNILVATGKFSRTDIAKWSLNLELCEMSGNFNTQGGNKI